MWFKEAQLLLWLIEEHDNWFLQMLCCDLVAYLRARGNIFEILLQHDRFCVWTDEVNLKTADLEKEKTARQSVSHFSAWGPRSPGAMKCATMEIQMMWPRQTYFTCVSPYNPTQSQLSQVISFLCREIKQPSNCRKPKNTNLFSS